MSTGPTTPGVPGSPGTTGAAPRRARRSTVATSPTPSPTASPTGPAYTSGTAPLPGAASTPTPPPLPISGAMPATSTLAQHGWTRRHPVLTSIIGGVLTTALILGVNYATKTRAINLNTPYWEGKIPESEVPIISDAKEGKFCEVKYFWRGTVDKTAVNTPDKLVVTRTDGSAFIFYNANAKDDEIGNQDGDLYTIQWSDGEKIVYSRREIVDRDGRVYRGNQGILNGLEDVRQEKLTHATKTYTSLKDWMSVNLANKFKNPNSKN